MEIMKNNNISPNNSSVESSNNYPKQAIITEAKK